jgi:hypothetical protein
MPAGARDICNRYNPQVWSRPTRSTYKQAVKDRDDFARNDAAIIDEVQQRCGKATMTDGEKATRGPEQR